MNVRGLLQGIKNRVLVFLYIRFKMKPYNLYCQSPLQLTDIGKNKLKPNPCMKPCPGINAPSHTIIKIE